MIAYQKERRQIIAFFSAMGIFCIDRDSYYYIDVFIKTKI